MILCIGSAADDTFVHTLSALSASALDFEAVDFVHLLLEGSFRVEFQDVLSAEMALADRTIRFRDLQGVYVRLLDVSQSAPTAALARRARAFHNAVSRVLSVLPIPVLNPPIGDASNSAKLFHAVALASSFGLQVPRSCLTSDPEEARSFIATCDGQVIFKGASARKTWVSAFDPAIDEARLPHLATCPTLFQERIVGPDVRVHVVGREIFAERIESPHVDYRNRHDSCYAGTEVPAPIGGACTRLTEELGMPFLGIDFKVERRTGEWFFLEANSLPCYQGYDRRAGGAIGRAIVEWFAKSSSMRSARESSEAIMSGQTDP